jgi:hypothetical protein
MAAPEASPVVTLSQETSPVVTVSRPWPSESKGTNLDLVDWIGVGTDSTMVVDIVDRVQATLGP